MAITFQIGTKIVLTDGLNRYELLVESASANQTFLEASQDVKTIHNRNLVERTFVTEKSAASLSFSCYLTGVTDSILFEWFGFNKVVDDFIINPTKIPLTETQEILDVYIDAGTTIYKLTGCIGETMSIKLVRGEFLKVDISAQAEDLTEVSSIPVIGSLNTQNYTDFYNGPVVVASYPNLSSTTCEITRSLTWVNKKSIHNIGSIYRAQSPVITSLAIAGSVTQTKLDNTNAYIPEGIIDITYNNQFRIYLDKCNLTERWSMGSYHTKVTDYKLLPTSTNSYITF